MTTNIVPLPNHQDIVGIAKDDENNNSPLAGVTAMLYNQTLNETLETITGSDGKFSFDNVPEGSECFISVGGLDGYYHWNNIEYTVPAIEEYSDTLMTDASAVMYAVQPDIVDFNSLIAMTSHGSHSKSGNNGIRTFWFADELTNNEEQEYRAAYAQYDEQTDAYTHVEVTNEADADIEIYDGTYNTTTNGTSFETPFGNLYPATIATMFLHLGDYSSYSHEFGQGDGMNQGGSGFLSSNPQITGPSPEDEAVLRIDYTHWVENVYGNQETYYDLNKLSDEFNNKSPNFKTP